MASGISIPRSYLKMVLSFMIFLQHKVIRRAKIISLSNIERWRLATIELAMEYC